MLIPKEELQRRKHPRGNDSSPAPNTDRGRGRGDYSRGGRSSNNRGRGRYRNRGRGKYRGNHNHYKPTHNTPGNPDGHAALVIIDDETNAPTAHSMDEFDWLSLGSFQPMDNTITITRMLK